MVLDHTSCAGCCSACALTCKEQHCNGLATESARAVVAAARSQQVAANSCGQCCTKVHQAQLFVGQLSTCDAIDAIPVDRCQCKQSSAGASRARGGATWRMTVALPLRSDQGSRPALLAPRHLSPMRAAHGPQPSIHDADASASAAAGHLSCTTGGLAPQHRPRGLCFMRCCCHCIV